MSVKKSILSGPLCFKFVLFFFFNIFKGLEVNIWYIFVYIWTEHVLRLYVFIFSRYLCCVDQRKNSLKDCPQKKVFFSIKDCFLLNVNIFWMLNALCLILQFFVYCAVTLAEDQFRNSLLPLVSRWTVSILDVVLTLEGHRPRILPFNDLKSTCVLFYTT